MMSNGGFPTSAAARAEFPLKKRLFFSAGEPSGDIHAAALITALQARDPSVKAVGFGGPRMRAVGARLLTDMTRHAVMWFGRAIRGYFHFKRLLADADRYFSENPVDAVILVDYPGFNWHVARAARRHGIPVFYFMPPQVWAWAQWRTKKMRELVNLTLCPLNFEARWFSAHGIPAQFIGHPFFEENRTKEPDTVFLEQFFTEMAGGPVLTLLPGSRTQEITKNLDDMLKTVEIVRNRIPEVKPVFAAFDHVHAEMIAERVRDVRMSVPVYAARTAELIRAADCCLAVSGSVSLELLACNKPTVIYYRVGAMPLLVQRFFRRAKYITLVNLLAADRAGAGKPDAFLFDDSIRVIPAYPDPELRNGMLFPEFLTADCRSRDAAAPLIEWLTRPEALARRKRELAELLREVDVIESPLDRAAELILAHSETKRVPGQT